MYHSMALARRPVGCRSTRSSSSRKFHPWKDESVQKWWTARGMRERYRCTYARSTLSRFTSPRCDSLSLNFHILTSGWPRQHHHLTSDGTDISLSWDARVRVGRLRGRRQGDGEVRVQHEVADATHDTLRVSATRCPHDVRCTAFKIRQRSYLRKENYFLIRRLTRIYVHNIFWLRASFYEKFWSSFSISSK